ncbi:MAG: helix-turn-helix domain-containing protein [Clostridia bacterium]|nr:helix-turn-helix domain-containing protein [Clostridia bacterium]
MSRIGSEINRLRTEKGITQKQLGKLVGVSEGFIIEVESGRRVVGDSLLTRIYKALGQNLGDENTYTADDKIADKDIPKKSVKAAPKPVVEVWSDALGSILKAVPVYDYKMDKELEIRKLPVIDNKVEGHAKDKVFYLRIEDEDMSGFRIAKGDMALAYAAQEIEKDAIFLIEYDGKRAVRQIKRLDGDKLLLVSNKGSLITETVTTKSIKVLAKLIRLEIKL